MPEIDIIWSPTALEHLEAIYDHILADNPTAALAVHEEIERTAGLLGDNPRLGHPGRVEATRALVVPAYLWWPTNSNVWAHKQGQNGTRFAANKRHLRPTLSSNRSTFLANGPQTAERDHIRGQWPKWTVPSWFLNGTVLRHRLRVIKELYSLMPSDQTP